MSRENCWTKPDKRLSIVSIILAIGACLLAISSSYGCYFVRVEGFMLGNSPYFVAADRYSGVGLWTYEDITRVQSICVMYNEDQIQNFLDLPWHIARAAGMASCASLGIAMFLVIAAAVTNFSSRGLKMIAALICVGAFFQVLTFLFFASKAAGGLTQGSFYAGSALSIGATTVALTCALTVWRWRAVLFNKPVEESPLEKAMSMSNKDLETGKKSKSKHFASDRSEGAGSDTTKDDDEEDDSLRSGDEKTITRVSSRDGELKVTNITVHGDGSRTVEHTIIPCCADLCLL